MSPKKLMAAATALAMVLSPVAASAASPLSPARAGATLDDPSAMNPRDRYPITAFIGAGILLAALAILIIAQDDDEDQPTSP